MPPAPRRSAPTGWWWMRVSGVLFCWELLLGMQSLGFIYFSSQLGCPPRFKNFPWCASERISWCLETSFIKTPFPGWISIPNSIVSLFIFYILSYLLSETMRCFSGCLMSSASDQKLFCGVCSAFKWPFDEFVG